MKKKLIVRQSGLKECGSACLLSVLRFYGGNAPLSKIIELTKTDKNGTNFYNMKMAANHLGLSAVGYYIEDNKILTTLELPIIVKVVKENYEHFVVIYKITNSKVIIMDPAKGEVIYKFNEFIKLFKSYVLVLEPHNSLTCIKNTNRLSTLIINIIRRNKNLLVTAFILSLIYSILSCIYSFYLGYMVDKSNITNNLLIITIIVISLIMIKCIINLIRNNLLINLSKKVDYSLITNTYSFILKLPYNYYRNKTTGEVISRINDLSSLKNLIIKVIVTLFLDVIIIILGIIILYNICHRLFYYVILIIVLYLIIFIIFKNIIKKITISTQENNAIINNLMVESITGFETIKGLNIIDVFVNRLKYKYLNLLETVSLKDRIINVEMFIRDLFEEIILVLIIYIGIIYVGNGILSLSGFITFNTLLGLCTSPLRNIIDSSKDYFFVSSAINRASELFEIKEEILDNDFDINIYPFEITINELTYSYNYKNNILSNINLSIKSGSKVLILGKSGSGKSTIFKLLYKYYNVERGKIFIGNYDINDYDLNTIRNSIGIISQNESLFSGTIKDNILLDRNIDYDDFIKVCKLTYIDEIVISKTTGYDYMIEEGGINISGGQKQRIILARMLLKPANIYLIDEGLNQLDINLERKILKNIFKQYPDKTIIIISHRLDNMDLYNKVIEMDDGNITKNMDKE